MSTLSVDQALAEAGACAVARLDAQLLLALALGRPRSWIAAHGEAALDAVQARTYRAQLARRAAGEPLAYLLGEKEFYGLTLRVNAHVLVPRPETELLVEWALELLRGPLATQAHPRVVDLGTGSGAIALALKQSHRAARVDALDASTAALDVARDNAARLSLDVALHRSHWWQALGGQRFHLALANPPYIRAHDPHLGALHHEPAVALTPGGDGLGALRTIVAGAAAHLEPGGWLLLEHGWDQADAVRAMLAQHGLQEVQTRPDLAGLARATGAHL
jgi:release factor glutamine methyltransferase